MRYEKYERRQADVRLAWILFAIASVFFTIGGMMGALGASPVLMIPAVPLYFASFLRSLIGLD